MELLSQKALLNDTYLQGYWPLNQTEDTNTKLLLHFNSADGATSTIESSTGKAVTFVGNAQLDTAQSKFGVSSLLLDGTGDYITLADSADWNLSNGDFTIDFWIKFNSLTGSFATQNFVQQYVDESNRWAFYLSSANNLEFLVVSSGVTLIDKTFAWNPSVDTWYHVALTRSGSNFRAFVNGTQVGNTETDADSIPDLAEVLAIGISGYAGGSSYINGWIDEFRLVKGTAKWTANFTAPTSPHSFQTDSFSKNGYHLITGTQPTNITGLFQQAGDFEASSSQYILLANASCPNLEIAGDKTFVARVKIEAIPSGDMAIAVKCNAAADKSFGFQVRGTGAGADAGKLRFSNRPDAGYWIESDSALSTGVWYFIVGTYDSATKEVKLFVDTLKKTSTFTGDAVDTDGDFAIGRLGAYNGQYFDGVIDDVAVFNRVLSDGEIMALYGYNAPFPAFRRI